MGLEGGGEVSGFFVSSAVVGRVASSPRRFCLTPVMAPMIG